MKKILSFLALTCLTLCYIPSPKVYEEEVAVLPLLFSNSENKMIMIPGYSNMIVYNAKGYILTSMKHLEVVVSYNFANLLLVEPIPQTQEAFLATSEPKISRVNYLSGEIIAHTSTDESAKVMMAGIDGSLAVIGQTKLKLFSSDLSSVTVLETFATDSAKDLLHYPLERSVYLLTLTTIIKHDLTPATGLPRIEINLNPGYN